MGTVATARKYTYAVIVVGILGVLAAVLFIWLGGRRIEELGRADLDAEARSVGSSIERLLVDAWADLRDSLGVTAWERFGGPLGERSWAAVEERLPVGVFELGDLKGVVVRSTSGDTIWNAGLPQLGSRPAPPAATEGITADGPWVAVTFTFTGGDTRGQAALVSAYIDQGRAAEIRQDLTDFITFGLIAITVSLYVLAAVTILLNRAQTRLLRTEHEKTTRLRAIGEVAGGIAHEVRNPLNAISLSVQYMQKLAERGDQQPRTRDYARIHLELGRIRKVVDSFVKFARIRDMVTAPMDLGDAMDEALRRFSADLGELELEPEVTRTGDLQCTGDRDKIVEVFSAVLLNALDGVRDEAQPVISVRVDGSGSEIRVSVRDNRQILDRAALSTIFEPTFSARDSAMGLGMTVARTFVESHGGAIGADLAQGGGCVVSVRLPRDVAG